MPELYLLNILSRHASGAVLCFLPGWQDIRAVQEKLEAKQQFSSGSQMIVPCKKVETNLQRLVFCPASTATGFKIYLFIFSFQCTQIYQ